MAALAMDLVYRLCSSLSLLVSCGLSEEIQNKRAGWGGAILIRPLPATGPLPGKER